MSATHPTDAERDRAAWTLLQAQIDLTRRQARWETPRNLAIIVGVVAALFSAMAGLVGYKLGSQPPQAIVVQFQQPLAVKVTP